VINGLYGNHIREQDNGLALGMTVRRDGRDVPLTPDGVAIAFPDASPRLAVFVHGLFGDELNWSLFPLRGRRPGRRSYGERLQEELGFTPVLVRYNTGLRVSQNGRELARVVEALRAAWPVPVEEVEPVGPSVQVGVDAVGIEATGREDPDSGGRARRPLVAAVQDREQKTVQRDGHQRRAGEVFPLRIDDDFRPLVGGQANP